MARIVVLLLALLSFNSYAETPNNIATLCKSQWPGNKGMQTFCIKEKRNYQDWMKYVRKRVYRDVSEREKIDECILDHKPDYREAYDCYFNDGVFNISFF
ncbi:hypothetical protein DV711_11445 [Motiliproteus coralliicola]|uniref:DUF1311 domain-containing protein n=1 Tax=Motiliproteus coralliicola TaxID=2283196 RepID=A0A369WBV1_9GAMM|nr:hypothetical protein [Motiliproteus coralliicola]RDE19498.1 hypothetical protein DV711_11445 [Motiliproteus coralliicola]